MQVIILKQDNEVTARLIGRLDTPASQEMSQNLDELQAAAAQTLILDCSELEYVASAGLRVLTQLHQTMKDKGGNLILKGIRPDVMDILEMTGFDAMLVIEQ